MKLLQHHMWSYNTRGDGELEIHTLWNKFMDILIPHEWYMACHGRQDKAYFLPKIKI